jgi:hypothetical protein
MVNKDVQPLQWLLGGFRPNGNKKGNMLEDIFLSINENIESG